MPSTARKSGSTGQNAAPRQPLIAAVTDLLCLTAYLLFAPAAQRALAEPSGWNALLVFLLYAWLCLSLSLELAGGGQSVRSRLGGSSLLPNLLLFGAFGFGFMVFYMMLDSGGQMLEGGLLMSIDLNSAAAAWPSLLAGAAVLALICWFPGVLLSHSTDGADNGAAADARPARLASGLSLQLSANALTQFTGLFLALRLGGEGNELSLGGKVLLWLCYFVLLLLFMAAPRLVIAWGFGGRISLVAALISIAVYPWGILEA